MNEDSDPLLYCSSPSGSTAAKPLFTSRFEVASILHADVVPTPPSKFGSSVAHAMSPATPITGADDVVVVVTETASLAGAVFPARSPALTVYVWVVLAETVVSE